ncbi:MAG: archaeosortase/exosortase family protein [Nanoarchaeota archaeon]
MKHKNIVLNALDKVRAFPGLAQFGIRAILLALFLILLQYFSLPFVDGIIIPTEFFTVQYIALSGTMMFSAVVFLLLVKDRLSEFPKAKFSLRDLLLFGVLGFLFHFLFFYGKLWISENPLLAFQNFYLVMGLRYLFLLLSLASFTISFFGTHFISKFVPKFRKELFLSAVFFIIFTGFSYLVQNSWKLLSFTITRTEYFVMSLIFDNVKLYGNESLGIGGFVVNIGKVCSGVESLMLFTSLYALIFFLDKKKLDTKRMLLLFIPGLIGDFFANILRITLILLLGVWINPQFAVGIFHTNAGWVLFILYFFVFWYFAYPWVKKSDGTNKKAH